MRKISIFNYPGCRVFFLDPAIFSFSFVFVLQEVLTGHFRSFSKDLYRNEKHIKIKGVNSSFLSEFVNIVLYYLLLINSKFVLNNGPLLAKNKVFFAYNIFLSTGEGTIKKVAKG